MKMVYDVGVYDMPRGWRKKCKWNELVYQKWHSMFVRCYSEKYKKEKQTYKNCYVCERWLYLSNFIEDIPNIDGYNETLFLNGELELDKDIKSDNQNKCYCLEMCSFVVQSENKKQAMKHRDYSDISERNNPNYAKYGKNHPHSVKVKQEDKQGNLIKIWGSIIDIERETGIKSPNIITCCKWYACNENKEEWYKTHKAHPIKSAGGFIWKYAEE